MTKRHLTCSKMLVRCIVKPLIFRGAVQNARLDIFPRSQSLQSLILRLESQHLRLFQSPRESDRHTEARA